MIATAYSGSNEIRVVNKGLPYLGREDGYVTYSSLISRFSVAPRFDFKVSTHSEGVFLEKPNQNLLQQEPVGIADGIYVENIEIKKPSTNTTTAADIIVTFNNNTNEMKAVAFAINYKVGDDNYRVAAILRGMILQRGTLYSWVVIQK